MPGERGSGWLGGMRILLATVALLAALAVPAKAGSVPPTQGGVQCDHSFKKRYKLARIARTGVPVKVSCDGPLKVLVMLDFDAGSDAQTELAETYGGHYPALAKPRYAKLTEAGTITVKVRWTKAARKILSHHAKTKIFVMLGTQRTDGDFWSGPGDWGHSSVVR
jgi:hypothetical protein